MDDKTIREIENLIDAFAKGMTDDRFIQALEEMIDRAQTALDARREELASHEQ